MEVHVLNGDALAHKLPFREHQIVCRECLIEGPVHADSMEQFWNRRAAFIASAYQGQTEIYFKNTKLELEKIAHLNPGSIVNLWFEHDLFCQVNMWFMLRFIRENKLQVKVNRVMPSVVINDWSGFGTMQEEELKHCYDARIEFSNDDITLGCDLWDAYQQNDLEKLQLLSGKSSLCFPYLKEVCTAHMQRFRHNGLGRPQQKLMTLMQSGITNFKELFKEFLKTESIYGFGDAQVKNMLENLSAKQ